MSPQLLTRHDPLLQSTVQCPSLSHWSRVLKGFYSLFQGARRIWKSGGGRADAGRKAGGGPGEDEGRQAGSRRGGAGTTAGGPQSRRDQRREAGEKSGKSLGKSKVDGKVNETMNRLRRPSAAQVTAFDCCRLQFSCCAARLPNFAAVVTTPAENSGRASIPPRISSSCSTNFSSRGIYTG